MQSNASWNLSSGVISPNKRLLLLSHIVHHYKAQVPWPALQILCGSLSIPSSPSPINSFWRLVMNIKVPSKNHKGKSSLSGYSKNWLVIVSLRNPAHATTALPSRRVQNSAAILTLEFHKQSMRYHLTHWGRDEIDAISQTTFSNAFYWIKIIEFRLEFNWSLFLRFELTIHVFHNWFR